MNRNEINKLIEAIELVESRDDKFKVNEWYEFNDTMRKKLFTYRVTHITQGHICFESVCGELETIDPQEIENSFQKHSLIYKDSVPVDTDSIVILRIKDRIRELL